MYTMPYTGTVTAQSCESQVIDEESVQFLHLPSGFRITTAHHAAHATHALMDKKKLSPCHGNTGRQSLFVTKGLVFSQSHYLRVRPLLFAIARCIVLNRTVSNNTIGHQRAQPCRKCLRSGDLEIFFISQNPGNGWAVAGLLHVLATIRQPGFANTFQSEQNNLSNGDASPPYLTKTLNIHSYYSRTLQTMPTNQSSSMHHPW